MEAETPKDAWRSTYGSYSKDYLTFLGANGYQLSDVEKVITGAAKADKLFDRISGDTKKTEKVA